MGGRLRQFGQLFKKARSGLCKLIKKAKAEAWDALIQTLDDNSWGLPYKIVMDRLRKSGSGLTESLEPAILRKLLGDLFPSGEVHDPAVEWQNWDGPMNRVSVDEVRDAIRGRRRGGCPAPGPDGLSLTIWKNVPDCMVECLASLYSLCMKSGAIPREGYTRADSERKS